MVRNQPLIKGWCKRDFWYKELKNSSRWIGQISSKGGKNKDEQLKKEVTDYTTKARKLENKITQLQANFTIKKDHDLAQMLELKIHKIIIIKHIDLLERLIQKLMQSSMKTSYFRYLKHIQNG